MNTPVEERKKEMNNVTKKVSVVIDANVARAFDGHGWYEFSSEARLARIRRQEMLEQIKTWAEEKYRVPVEIILE